MDEQAEFIRMEIESFVKDQYNVLRRIAAGKCRPAHTELTHVSGFNVDDVTQEICLAIWANWTGISHGPEIFGFASTVACNHCADLWAKQKRRERNFEMYQKEVVNG